MSIYSNEKYQKKITKLSPHEFPHLVQTAKKSVRKIMAYTVNFSLDSQKILNKKYCQSCFSFLMCNCAYNKNMVWAQISVTQFDYFQLFHE